MGLFRRWFGETERTSHEAVASPAAPETLEQQGRRNAVSDESVRRDGEQEEDSRIRAKMVYLQMGGGCQGCGMADVTLKQGIETMIREELPEVADIIDVTDHAAGENPYSAASKK